MCLWAITASSQINNSALRISSPNSLFTFIPQVESASTFNGTLNVECTVFPPSNNDAAMPEVATANAILFSYLSLHNKVL